MIAVVLVLVGATILGYIDGRIRPLYAARERAWWQLNFGDWPCGPMKFRALGLWVLLLRPQQSIPAIYRIIFKRERRVH